MQLRCWQKYQDWQNPRYHGINENDTGNWQQSQQWQNNRCWDADVEVWLRGWKKNRSGGAGLSGSTEVHGVPYIILIS